MLKSNEEINIYLAECIRIKREKKGLSQRQLAKLCNVNQSIISKMEGSNGYTQRHHFLSVVKVCNTLKIDAKELFKGFNE